MSGQATGDDATLTAVDSLLAGAAALWASVNEDDVADALASYSTIQNRFLWRAESAFFDVLDEHRPAQRTTSEGEWEPPARVLVLMALDGESCHYCGVALAATAGHRRAGRPTPTVDHVVPRSDGGSDDIANLVLACGSCNSSKGSRSYMEFMRARRSS